MEVLFWALFIIWLLGFLFIVIGTEGDCFDGGLLPALTWPLFISGILLIIGLWHLKLYLTRKLTGRDAKD